MKAEVGPGSELVGLDEQTGVAAGGRFGGCVESKGKAGLQSDCECRTNGGLMQCSRATLVDEIKEVLGF